MQTAETRILARIRSAEAGSAFTSKDSNAANDTGSESEPSEPTNPAPGPTKPHTKQ